MIGDASEAEARREIRVVFSNLRPALARQRLFEGERAGDLVEIEIPRRPPGV